MTSSLVVELYQQIAARRGNLMLSPYSVWTALAMVLPGARGRTRQQLVDRLGIDDVAAVAALRAELATRADKTEQQRDAVARGWQKDGSFGFHLEVANKLWIQTGYPIELAYAQALAAAFAVDPAPVDFRASPDAACAAINRWVHDQTHGRIATIVDRSAIVADLRAILANAIYFKAAWLDEFNERATAPKPFRLLDGTTAAVPTMRRTGSFAHCEDTDYVAVQLPYINPAVAMVVLVPRAFDTFELTQDRLDRIVRGLAYKQVDLELPKFTFDTSLSLADPLRALGCDEMLSSRADLGGVSAEPGFAIGEVLHKTFVKVDEKGTEAAAVTAVMLMGAGMPAPPTPVRVDRPFFFLVRDVPTGTALFFGRVVDPR